MDTAIKPPLCEPFLLDRRYPDGNTEYQFFYKAFGIIDNVIEGLYLQNQFREARDREGDIDIKDSSPVFSMHTISPGYITGVHNVADLLDNVSRRSDLQMQMKQLKRLAESVVTTRETDRPREMSLNKDQDFIEHQSTLDLWKQLVLFIDWIVSGRIGAEPEFIGKMAKPMPLHFAFWNGEPELQLTGVVYKIKCWNTITTAAGALTNPNEQSVIYRLILDGMGCKFVFDCDSGIIAQEGVVYFIIELKPLHKWKEVIGNKVRFNLIIESMFATTKRIPDESSLWKMFEVANPRRIVRTEINCTINLSYFSYKLKK